MSSAAVPSDFILQAVFTVCSSNDVAASVAAACAEVPGAVFVGEFQEYFDGDRRVQFASNVLNATGTVALVDCDRDPEQALATMQSLHAAGLKNIKVVGLGTSINAEYLLKAMQVGCNEFLPKPAEPAVVKGSLKRFQSAHIAHTAVPDSAGRILSLLGAKGGVGTTTLAVHLASNLVRRHRKRVLLIDHHHELGHVALLLGIRNGQYHFDELVRTVNRLDADLLKGLVTQHPSGLDVLTSPDTCAAATKAAPEDVKAVFSFLRTQYDYILIDSSMANAQTQGPILEVSDEVYLISTPDVAALRDLARRVEHLALTQNTNGRLRIVINRSTSEDAVSPEQVEAAVHYPVWIAIPNNYSDLVRAINAGEPIPADHRSGFAQHITKWAQKLVTTSVTQVAKPTADKRPFTFWRRNQTVALGGHNG